MKKLFLIASLFIAVQASAQNSSKSYIDKFKDDAVRIMKETGVPASIILAVAMHESGNGNSSIAQNLNNQFGVKGSSVVIYKRRKKKYSTFYKRYDSVMESFEDFARIVTQRKKFSILAASLTNLDYMGWANGIQRCGYASSRKWAAQVLGIINKYQLDLFDQDSSGTPLNLTAAVPVDNN